MNGRAPGKGKLAAELDRVPASEAKAVPAAKPKTGLETVHEKGWQQDADSDPQDMVRIVDHDANKVLFFGTAAEHRALKRALAGD